LDKFIKANKEHDVYNKRVVLIFDECHRSQFGDMHKSIVKHFKKYNLFGFTGTPIVAKNSSARGGAVEPTTEQIFGDRLHTYTIVDAINDNNVLKFRVEYLKTMDAAEDMTDEQVANINRESAFNAPKRIVAVTRYILEHFEQKTYRSGKIYLFNTLDNIARVATAGRKPVEEKKSLKSLRGFSSILAVSSIQAAKLYYCEFKRQMAELPEARRLRIATIFSYGANEDEPDGILGEENSEDTSALDKTSRDFLEDAIRDYNEMFRTSYDTSGESFQNYYKDISLRMKNREIDLLIVVNMFLTGFDATTLNTLWVDKNLKMHGLIQAFSRTNRILNSVKTFGNIICFRNLQKEVDEALSLFGNKDAGGVVLLRKFDDYYNGFIDDKGVKNDGYVEIVEALRERFPLDEQTPAGENEQKDFISLFGAFLRMRNLLLSFDDFAGKEILPERDMQDYLSRYQDLRDEFKRRRESGESVDIIDDIVFEVELIKQIEINIDYILMLVDKYREKHGRDKEILVTITKAVDASPELRSKKELIEAFIVRLNEFEDSGGDVAPLWRKYVTEERERELSQIIAEERLKEPETRKFVENAFRDGEVKTTGTEIDSLLPPMSRFSKAGGDRKAKKEGVIKKLTSFFEKFFGIFDAGDKDDEDCEY
ncbi:MAG: type I restriction endonuclease subunit R, partial [Synergistes sp.]|nr:type I restriction endonuclease subunit R [Synergistes sp.]